MASRVHVSVRAQGAASSAAAQLPSIQDLNKGALQEATNAASAVNSDSAVAGASNAVDAINSAGLDASSLPPEVLYAGLGVIGASKTHTSALCATSAASTHASCTSRALCVPSLRGIEAC